MTNQNRGSSGRGTNSGSFKASVGAEATPLQPDWRDQAVVVMGRKFTLNDVHGGRIFHGSKHEIEDGDFLEPGHVSNFTQSDSDAVSVTSEAGLALHWAQESAGGEPAYVYEVEPAGTVEVWRAGLANAGKSLSLSEGRVAQARVIRKVDLRDAQAYQSSLRNGLDPLRYTESG